MMAEEELCLGIESTAHTYGVAIATSRGKILSDVKSVYTPQLGKGRIVNFNNHLR